MDEQRFWDVIEEARARAGAPAAAVSADVAVIAREARGVLSEFGESDLIQAQQRLWDLLARSYRTPLWGAAYLVNGGCSDDGFEYFRGWLIAQGRAMFERVVAHPDALAQLTGVREALADLGELEGEEMLGVAWDAFRLATGRELPVGVFTVEYPDLAPGWDFEDEEETGRRLPGLRELCRSE
ncbi:DUF4240 domain-containing protein [Streptomyces sp. BI20]|uniref:DUF4240 domain-containing protein n=1 Tax=Streptomyces sp. BI20 TaxID=3403460 RepID=UPI003C768DC8